MRNFLAALGLGLAILPGAVDGFAAPASGLVGATASTGRGTGASRGRSAIATTAFGEGGCRQQLSAHTCAGTLPARRGVATVLRGGGAGEEEEKPTSSAAMSGVGSVGSNVLLLLATAMVVKGLLLPEDIRHLGFCPTEDPIRGRDTLPWRMMIESGRECGTVPEVMMKYVTAPLAFPGTPEWGMMLNTKEELAKDAWLQ